MELNAEQIKKALECCCGDIVECQKCAYVKNGYSRCKERASQDALALINSLEQRIGAQDMTISELRQKLKNAEHDADRYAQRINELSEENERILTALANYDRQTDERIAENYYTVEAYEELREENERLRADCVKGANALIEEMVRSRAIKADTVRKMQCEIKERCIKGGIYPAFVASTIDKVAKEMLEDEKNERKN
jgi:uncharacterized coiled-coil protein SlyX